MDIGGNIITFKSRPEFFELEKSEEEHWIPKSQCKIIERKEVSLDAWR